MELQFKFGSKFCKFNKLNTHEKEQWTKEFCLCIIDEISEVLNWINWKHWKKKRYPIDELNLKYELIDLMHFILSLMLIWKMTPEDVFTMYLIKNQENHNRQLNGY
jgi:dimeric dUTPase (all-alpha-NTP-PPase superfamily)